MPSKINQASGDFLHTDPGASGLSMKPEYTFPVYDLKKEAGRKATINSWSDYEKIIDEMTAEFPGKTVYVRKIIHQYPVDVEMFLIHKPSGDIVISVTTEESEKPEEPGEPGTAMPPYGYPSEFYGVIQIRPDVWELRDDGDLEKVESFYKAKFDMEGWNRIDNLIGTYPLLIRAEVTDPIEPGGRFIVSLHKV